MVLLKCGGKTDSRVILFFSTYFFPVEGDEMNQIYLMRFGMKNDTYFFLHIILYKNRAERARKTAWQTNENAQRIEN